MELNVTKPNFLELTETLPHKLKNCYKLLKILNIYDSLCLMHVQMHNRVDIACSPLCMIYLGMLMATARGARSSWWYWSTEGEDPYYSIRAQQEESRSSSCGSAGAALGSDLSVETSLSHSPSLLLHFDTCHATDTAALACWRRCGCIFGCKNGGIISYLDGNVTVLNSTGNCCPWPPIWQHASTPFSNLNLLWCPAFWIESFRLARAPHFSHFCFECVM